MKEFVYDALPGRIVFGVGALSRLPDEVDGLDAKRVFVVTDQGTKEIADRVIDDLGDRFVGVFTDIELHVPVGGVERATSVAERVIRKLPAER